MKILPVFMIFVTFAEISISSNEQVIQQRRIDDAITVVQQISELLESASDNRDNYAHVVWTYGHISSLILHRGSVFYNLGNWIQRSGLKSQQFSDLEREFKRFARLLRTFDLKMKTNGVDDGTMGQYKVALEDINTLYSSGVVFSLLDYSAIRPTGGLERFKELFRNKLSSSNPLTTLLNLCRSDSGNGTVTFSLLDNWPTVASCHSENTGDFVHNINWLIVAGLISEELYLGITAASNSVEFTSDIGMKQRSADYTQVSRKLTKILAYCWRRQERLEADADCRERIKAVRGSVGQILVNWWVVMATALMVFVLQMN